MLQDVLQPGAALEVDDLHLPDAAQTGAVVRREGGGLVEGRDEEARVDLVFVRPPVDEGKPGRLGVVSDDEAGAPALGQRIACRVERGRDELGAGVVRVCPDAVDLQAPALDVLAADEADRAGLVDASEATAASGRRPRPATR